MEPIKMEEKNKVKNLLSPEEQLSFYEARARLYRADLYDDLSGVEYKQLYQKASELLLSAVDRELERKGLR